MQQSLADATRAAQALKAQGRLEDAIKLHRRIVAAYPASAIARHNLASALGDAGYWGDAEPVIRQALSMGLDAPESWLVLARALQTTGRLDEAEDAYAKSVSRRPSLDAHRELAQLRWMRSGDIANALLDLDRAITAAPAAVELQVVKAQALVEAEENDAAFALMQRIASSRPGDAGVAAIAAQTALSVGRSHDAIVHARRALDAAPNLPAAHAVLIEALLNLGEFAQASAAAEYFRRVAPLDQHAIALQASAWRALGDPRYGELYDYDAFVCTTTLETPPGWSTLDSYLADLAAALKQAHHFQTHPFAQSIRHGSQAANILSIQSDATRALPQALDKPLRSYLAALGEGADPMRSRRTGAYAFQGMWSILMRAGGRHINHVHPQGWISSACYVETPAAGAAHEGCLALGAPSVACGQDAERYVTPTPGRLVLFPSYMWHGTVPFTADGVRLTFAFDVLPA